MSRWLCSATCQEVDSKSWEKIGFRKVDGRMCSRNKQSVPVTQLEEPRLITCQMSGGPGEQRKAAATAAGWMRLEEVTEKGGYEESLSWM